MKKSLLMVAAFAFVFSTFAQRNMQAIKKDNAFATKQYLKTDQNESLGPVNQSKSVVSTAFHSSLNGYTLLSGKKVTADQTSKKALYIARAGGSFGYSGNDISHKMTTNGVDFDSVTFVNAEAHRYPGGTFFKDGNDLYVVSSGPITGGSGWTANFLYSAKTDGTNAADTVFNNPTGLGSFMMNECLTVLPTGELFISGEKNGPEPDYSHLSYVVWKFMWNSTAKKFNFVSETEFTPALNADAPPVQPQGMAFSPDGTVGYYWVNHQDADPLVTYNQSTQPMIWKTTDKGDNWNRVPNYDFSTVLELKDYIWPIIDNEDVIRPVFFYGYVTSDKMMPGVVDNTGNLHLLARIQGGYSNHADSLDYTYVYEEQKIFDLFMKSDGTWGATFIDTLQSDINEGGEFGDFSLDHRLHMGRTEDGTRIFAMWTDTQADYDETNIVPDFKAWGYNLTDNTQTIAKNFSINTGIEGSFLYMNASDIIIHDNNKFIIPVVSISGSTPESEILHHYVSGIEFANTDFGMVSINNIDKNLAAVSPSYPNPTNGTTSVDVTLVKGSELSIQIVNIMGQVVYTESKGNVAEGKYRFTFDASQFRSGIYFYTVKAGNSNQTSKMIVQ